MQKGTKNCTKTYIRNQRSRGNTSIEQVLWKQGVSQLRRDQKKVNIKPSICFEHGA